MKITNKKIAIIGMGHIGRAIAQGLHHNLLSSNGEKNVEVTKASDIIIIAVKPKVVVEVIKEVRDYVRKEQLIISTAACVTLDLLEKYFGRKDIKIIRIMPNIPVAYGLGVVGWIGNKQVNSNDKKLIKSLFTPLGYLIECKNEKHLDKLSMISGCGPGYVGYFINNLEKVAKKYGFSIDARKIVEATFFGTLHHLKKSKLSSRELVSSVATKGGITEEVLKNLEAKNFTKHLSKSIEKGYIKIKKITEELRMENNDI